MKSRNWHDLSNNNHEVDINYQRIYLFGSYAWGEPTIDSDLDLLIIVADSHEKPYRRMKPAYQVLRGMKVPKDILVYTENEFENYATEPSSLFFKMSWSIYAWKSIRLLLNYTIRLKN